METPDSTKQISMLVATCNKFKRRIFLFYSLTFLAILCLTIALIIFLPFFYQASWIAAAISCWVFLIFCAIFSYFQWDHHFKQQLEELVDAYQLNFKGMKGEAMGNLLQKSYNIIRQNTSAAIVCAGWLQWLQPLITLISTWITAPYLKQLQVQLLVAATENYLHGIRTSPSDPLLHLHLSKVYVHLHRHGQEQKLSANLQLSQLRECAIQESEIVKALLENEEAPALWIFLSLAENALDLDLPKSAITLYETAMGYYSDNIDLALTLGKLYFNQQLYAKGLLIYDRLSHMDKESAQELLDSYLHPLYNFASKKHLLAD